MSETGRGPAADRPNPGELEREAVDVALNFLSYRPRTRREVQRKLAQRGYDEETVEGALRRLSAVGLIDDEAFVGAYVRDRVAHRPMGVRRMVRELWVKGVPREVSLPVIEAVLREEDTGERSLARRMAERKARALTRYNPELARRRLRHAMLRRGFDTGIVRDVVDEVFPSAGGRA